MAKRRTITILLVLMTLVIGALSFVVMDRIRQQILPTVFAPSATPYIYDTGFRMPTLRVVGRIDEITCQGDMAGEEHFMLTGPGCGDVGAGLRIVAEDGTTWKIVRVEQRQGQSVLVRVVGE